MSRLFLYFLQFRQFRQFESYSRFFCRHFHNNYWVLYVSILYLLSLYNYRSLNTSTRCRLAHPYFLNSELRNSILDGATFIRFIGSGNFRSASIGIFLISACSLYLSENNQPPLPFPSPAYLSVFRNLHTYHRLQGTHSYSFQVL